MKNHILTALALAAATSLGAHVGALVPQGPQDSEPAAASTDRDQRAPTFDEASSAVRTKLDDALAELAALRDEISQERVPLGEELRELEAELIDVRGEYNETTRRLDVNAQELISLNERIDRRRDEASYLTGLFLDYARNFDSRITIAEKQRYQDRITAALNAPEDVNLSESEIFAALLDILDTGLDRLDEAVGGMRFEGRAVDTNGLLGRGSFLVVGPQVLFASESGQSVGLVEQRLGSTQPSVVDLGDEQLAAAALAAVRGTSSTLPLDPTLGNAIKIARTKDTLLDEFEKGGDVMYAILAMAAIATLVALWKALAMAFVRRPRRKQIARLDDALEQGDADAARSAVHAMRGPAGRMLGAGVRNLGQPRDLIEEIMYEDVLTTRFKLNRALPFIAICAASAPLLGLLGTVSGIIRTFQMITIYGSGDVKTLSGGISEALITTKYGLIVAIPALLLHAFLSRRARSIVGDMEKAAVRFVNMLSKSPLCRTSAPQRRVEANQDVALTAAAPDPELVKRQVSEILGDMLGPLVDDERTGTAQAEASTAR